ncbi:MAG: 50S ribosomal protein L4 [Alphaproteobacteria bacterium]
MKFSVINIKNEIVGEVDVSDSIFSLPSRSDLLARVVRWQLAARQRGTHKTKGISDVSGTTKKPWNQKGTGRARQGSLRSPQFRGGAVIFGPVVRDHSHDLPKKVRKLALKTALSVKAAENKIVILDEAIAAAPKTKELSSAFKLLGWSSSLIVDGEVKDKNFSLAVRNIPGVTYISDIGVNVYDILRHDSLVITKNALQKIEERLV